MFEHLYEPRYGDYQTLDTVKPAVLLDMAQDIAIRHSAARGYDLVTLGKMHRAWLLQGAKLRLEQPVSTHLPIIVRTAIRKNGGVISERGCLFLQEDKIIAKTMANWFFFDTGKSMPCRIPPEMSAAFPHHDFQDDFFHYTKFSPMEAPAAYTIAVHNKEIDTNHHLNNQKSAELLMDALPADFLFTDMNIFYKQPAYLGDQLITAVAPLSNGYYVELRREDNEQLCVAGRFTCSP